MLWISSPINFLRAAHFLYESPTQHWWNGKHILLLHKRQFQYFLHLCLKLNEIRLSEIYCEWEPYHVTNIKPIESAKRENMDDNTCADDLKKIEVNGTHIIIIKD